MTRAFWITVIVTALAVPAVTASETLVDIGSRLEMMVDQHLIDRLEGGAQQRLHRPEAREVAMVTDKPWEGNACHYRTVFFDEGVYKMYYLANHYPMGQLTNPRRNHGPFLCYAESTDGVTWTRPNLGLVAFQGSTDNNIVLDAQSPIPEGYRFIEMGFTVFRDANPEVEDDARYKAVAITQLKSQRGKSSLLVFKSADGLRWTPMHDEPVITDGRFDSQNLAFYDGVRQEYRAYYRAMIGGVRAIETSTSSDFINWRPGVALDYGDSPKQALYTNQVQLYPRAPHVLVGFPMRYNHRQHTPSMDALPGSDYRQVRADASERYGAVLTDALFMVSRDGVKFTRYDEAFIRPQTGRETWAYGDNSVAWGMAFTPSSRNKDEKEISLYATEGYWTDDSMNVRRYVLRLDGFVSIETPFSGGEMVTVPVKFEGDRLSLNFATSAAGSVRVELQKRDGSAYPGFAIDDCEELFGDDLSQHVYWKNGPDLAELAGKPVRLRFVMKDANLFAMQFVTTEAAGVKHE